MLKDTKSTISKVRTLGFVLLIILVRIYKINMNRNVPLVRGALDIIVCSNLDTSGVNVFLYGDH